jgi:hypothetical protein
MTDDDRLAALFREAAGDPPPGFDHRAVVERSRRVTARRRTALLGSAAALVVVVGTGLAVGGATPQEPASTAAAPAAERGAGGAADAAGSAESGPGAGSGVESGADAEAASPFAVEPYVAPAPAPTVGSPVPRPGAVPCADRPDPALRALLDRALPEVAGAPEAAATGPCRPGARGVDLAVVDGTASGLLSVVALPPGEPPLQSPDAAIATAPTASGGVVVVRSQGDGPGAPAPFAGRLDAVAAALAPAL